MRRFLVPTLSAALLAASLSSVMAADAGSLGQQGPDQWRASKLSGVTIMGPDNRTVGKVSDILMSPDGKAEYVIIGVGGFLGMGEKDVAVPFDQVKFTMQPLTPPPNPAPANNLATPAATPGVMAPNGGVAPAAPVGLGTPATDAGAPAMANGATMPAHSTAYPDHGTIDMTKDQLMKAPAFHFAR